MVRKLTVQDIMQFYENQALAPSVSPEDSVFQKAMINTGLGTGVWNPIYGSQAWFNLNAEANWGGVLPKMNWDKSGYRTINAFPDTSIGSVSVSETGQLPTPTYPTINTVKMNPKIVTNTFMTTEIVEQLAKISQDDIYANLDTIRGFEAVNHAKLINLQTGQLAVGTSQVNSVSGASLLMLESIDRIVASYAEGTGIGLSGTTVPTLANCINPYSGAVDRHAGASSWDAYVISGSGTIGTSGAITDAVIRKLMQGVRVNGAFSNVFVTGYDTYADLQGLEVTGSPQPRPPSPGGDRVACDALASVPSVWPKLPVSLFRQVLSRMCGADCRE